MKILLLSTGVLYRKSYIRNFSLARGLVRLGHDVTLAVCSQDSRFHQLETDGVEILAFPEVLSYRLRKGGLGLVDTCSRLIRLFSRNFDLVHVDEGFRPSAGFVGHVLARHYGAPYVCDWWDWIGFGGLLDERSTLYKLTLGASDNFLEVFEKKHADGIICVSHTLRDRALGIGIDEERVCVINGGADVDSTLHLDRDSSRHALGLSVDDCLVGFSGIGPFECADLEPFFEALSDICSRVPNLRWFATGGDLPESYRKRYGIGGEYIPLAWVSETQYWQYLVSADVLLLVQRDNLVNRARWPSKLGDYLSAGRPIVATPVGEVGLFAQRYPGSLLLTEWTATSVGESIVSAFADPQKLAAIGKLNRGIAETDYSWDNKAKEFASFYEHILRISD